MNSRQALVRNNVNCIGSGEPTLVLAHGFGCDQNMWRHLSPFLDSKFRIVLFDYVGCGGSDLAAFDPSKYATLDGYAQDVIDICDALALNSPVIIGHSVSAMIGLKASIRRPDIFGAQIMVCPSPCFLNDPPGYHGGFERADLEELIALMDRNHVGWANHLAPLVMGLTNPAALIEELSDSFCSTDPLTAKTFAKATFFADCRADLAKSPHATLVVQSESDALASVAVGAYCAERMRDAEMTVIPAEGHCLHMTRPEAVATAVLAFLEERTRLEPA